MTEVERVEDWREFLDAPLLGIPLIWYVGAIFLACMTCLAWIAVTGYRKRRTYGAADMDYRLLLKKYIEHILDHEGTSYITDIHKARTGFFTDAEWDELERLRDEELSQ